MLDHGMSAADTRLIDAILRDAPNALIDVGAAALYVRRLVADGMAYVDARAKVAIESGLNTATLDAAHDRLPVGQIYRGRFAGFDADEIEVLTVALRGFPVGSITGLIAKALIAEIGSMPGVR